MKVARKVGFFFELPLPKRREALSAVRRGAPDPEEQKIIHYLESGTVCAVVPGLEEDVLCNPPKVIGSPDLKTDGDWVWPQTTTYYLQHYHIELPEEFITDMRMRDWKCPSNVDLRNLRLEGQVVIG